MGQGRWGEEYSGVVPVECRRAADDGSGSLGTMRQTTSDPQLKVVSTAVVRMGEGALVDGMPASGPKYHATHGVGCTAAESATDDGWVSCVRCRLMVVSTAAVRMGEGACVDGGD